MNRREFGQHLGAAALSTAFAKLAIAQQQTDDTSGQQRSIPAKPAEIAMEYDPQPPFGTGVPEKATPAVEKISHSAFDPLHAAFRDAALEARKKWVS